MTEPADHYRGTEPVGRLDPDDAARLAHRGPDRRQSPRRAEDQRLHLARELVIEKARQVAHAHTVRSGWTLNDLDALVELVDVLETAETEAREVPARG